MDEPIKISSSEDLTAFIQIWNHAVQTEDESEKPEGEKKWK